MTCSIKGCKRDSVIIYYRNEICDHHWDLYCSDEHSFDLKKRLKIKPYTQVTLK